MSDEVEIGVAVASVVIERLGGRPCLPLPCDVPSEAELLGAVLSGYAGAVQAAKELSPSDFSDEFWQDVWVTMDSLGWEKLTVPFVASVMAAADRGYIDDIAIRLMQATDCNPLVPRQNAQRIRRASTARRMVKWLRTMEEDLCLARLTVDQAKERMRKAVERK